MKHLTLPTRRGSVTLEASRIDEIEWTGELTCKIHMKKVMGLGWTERFYKKDGTIDTVKTPKGAEAHNTFEVNWSAYELRNEIARMSDGDHFDPLNLETLDDE